MCVGGREPKLRNDDFRGSDALTLSLPTRPRDHGTTGPMSVNLLNLQWRAPEFLLACPTGTLASRSLALEYFSLSPFFDKASSNAQLRMQMMFSRGGMDGVDEEAELA